MVKFIKNDRLDPLIVLVRDDNSQNMSIQEKLSRDDLTITEFDLGGK